MNSDRWCYAGASVIGTSHVKSGTPCQDNHRVELLPLPDGGEVLLVAVSDGAGSAPYSQIGSRVACDAFVSEASAALLSGMARSAVTRAQVEHWVSSARLQIQLRAKEDNRQLRDYACTLLCAIVTCDTAAFWQTGDGAIVIREYLTDLELSWVFWPNRGEYANTTVFLTMENYLEVSDFDLMNRSIGELALLTDGIQPLALHYASMTAYSPFFNPIFSHLRTQPYGKSELVCRQLGVYLDSPPINSRVDDDKTLAIASRWGNSDSIVHAAPTPVDRIDDASV